MTLIHDLHSALGSFEMAFEETNEENAYKIRTYSNFPTLYEMVLPKDGVVRFSSRDKGLTPVPDKTILATHAAIAQNLAHNRHG
ncbi:hypothetical protein VTN77DRAFT_2058 [Rasamsonia byssochlamydoides]|uniref:uncharacterized protein n=1 Tax=Rasamsonia byssochlamydoides TaxID=89139 RepID=UPI0037437AF3